MIARKRPEPNAGKALTNIGKRGERAMRTCLGPLCLGRKSFLSDHPGNRLCPGCKGCVRLLSGHAPDPDTEAPETDPDGAP